MSNKENTIQEIIISDVHIKSYYYNERPNYNKKIKCDDSTNYMCIIERNMKNILKQYPLKMGMNNYEIIVTAKTCVETSNKYYTVVECLYSSKSGFKYRIN